MFERINTYYHTLKTWIGHNAMRYHKFNALPHALPYYILSQCSMVWGLFAIRCHALPSNLLKEY